MICENKNCFAKFPQGTIRLAGAVFVLIAAVAATAQLPTATILGTVKDRSGAVVPGASLTARSTETGQTRTTTSAANGSYRFSALPVGPYEVRVEQPGFQTEVRSGLTLAVAQEAVVNFTLEVGAVEQTVAVTAEAPLVNTTSGSLGGLVDSQRMADLPLNGRNYVELTLLQTGVSEHKNLSKGGFLTGTWYSSSGAPIRSNNFMLDGAQTQNIYGGSGASSAGSTLGVEGIREYRVVTNSFSAEYGMTMGSQMVIVSKGGTNSFHGSLFEYLRNDNLDARNFFDLRTSLTPKRLPEFKRNQFGGSFGGPILRDKTFFFNVYEGIRVRLGVTNLLRTIPPEAKVDGGRVPQIAPVIRPLLAQYPDPNLPNNEFTFPFSQPIREDYGQSRVDHTFSSDDTFFARYTIHDTEDTRPQGFPQFQTFALSRMQYGTVSENHVFSPLLLNTFRFSYSRTNTQQVSPTDLIGPQYSFVPGREIGSISITGISGFGPSGIAPIQGKQNIFTWSDDVFYTRGQHSWKFGTLINRYQQYFENSSNAKGSISFANLNDFLLGRPRNYSGVTPGSNLTKSYYYTTLGFYDQDDWRVRSNLTLNLGLRYEFQTTVQEIQGLGSNIRDLRNDAEATIGDSFTNPSLRNISPRFGFAWDVAGDGKTAVRGGFGLLYDLGNLGSVLIISAVGTPPFASQSLVASPPTLALPLFFPPEAVGKRLRLLDYNLEQPHLLQYNLAIERQLPWDSALTLAYGGSRGLNLFQGREGNPTVPQILPDGRKFWTGTEPLINPNWASIELKTAGGNSWYNSFQLGLMKRLTRGVQFQGSYTLSKMIDEGQSQLNSDNTATSSIIVDASNPKLDRGLSAYDATHNFRFNGIYRLPEFSSQGAAAKLLNGWWVSGILTLQSGYPFTPVLGSNRSRSQVNGSASGIDRPDILPGRNNDNIIRGGPDRYFDPTAFAIPAAGFLGMAGRDIIRGPGFANLDFSLAKDTALGFLGESGKLEFRAEFFNILNRANFSTPNRTVFAARANVEAPVGNAGRIDSTSNTSRQIQLALKLLF